MIIVPGAGYGTISALSSRSARSRIESAAHLSGLMVYDVCQVECVRRKVEAKRRSSLSYVVVHGPTLIWIMHSSYSRSLTLTLLSMMSKTMQLGVGSLAKFGGVLRQFVVDDKGCVMIGAFGLPQYRCARMQFRINVASATRSRHKLA